MDGEEAWYYAPDARVLLSDAFLDTHCFRTVRGRGEARGLLGLAFEPVRGKVHSVSRRGPAADSAAARPGVR